MSPMASGLHPSPSPQGPITHTAQCWPFRNPAAWMGLLRFSHFPAALECRLCTCTKQGSPDTPTPLRRGPAMGQSSGVSTTKVWKGTGFHKLVPEAPGSSPGSHGNLDSLAGLVSLPKPQPPVAGSSLPLAARRQSAYPCHPLCAPIPFRDRDPAAERALRLLGCQQGRALCGAGAALPFP